MEVRRLNYGGCTIQGKKYRPMETKEEFIAHLMKTEEYIREKLMSLEYTFRIKILQA
jgi:hypothetical protein